MTTAEPNRALFRAAIEKMISESIWVWRNRETIEADPELRQHPLYEPQARLGRYIETGKV